MTLPGSRRAALREHTRAAHAAVELAYAALDLTTRQGYGMFLRAHAAAIIAVERRLVDAGVATIVPDWPQRSRSGAVVHDMRQLGLQMLEVDCPALQSRGAVLAAVYVLEGSRLGGRILLAQVLRAAGPDLSAATTYLQHQPGARLWSEFLVLLDRPPAAASGIAADVAVAVSIFAVFAHAIAAARASAPPSAHAPIADRRMAPRALAAP